MLMSLPNLKSQISKLYEVNEIHVLVEEYDGEYDIVVDIWYSDRHRNEGFESFTRDTVTDYKQAAKMVVATVNSLQKLYGSKVEYTGFTVCR